MKPSNKNINIKKLIPKSLIYAIFIALFLTGLLLSVWVGSVDIPIFDTLKILLNKLPGINFTHNIPKSYIDIIEGVRLPRVILAALVGAALSIAGAAMQGLLRNPLADSSTLGVSSCAALGSVLAIALKLKTPILPQMGVFLSGIAFALLSFVAIIALSYRIDPSLSTNTIILTGVIISMFAGSMISFIVFVSKEQMRNILFWTMGSFAGRGWEYVAITAPIIIIGSLGILGYWRELNAFALGEEKARYLGVSVKRVKITIMVFVSMLVGVSVSASGTIAFVGLVIPHITRMLSGPNHRHLLPLSLIGGATFMMFTDLASRRILRPAELPIGVVTSLIGSIIFIYIFHSQRNKTS